MADQWETVEVPSGRFIGWGDPGQQIEGEVIAYSESGGTAFNGEPCPQVEVQLLKPAATYKEKGTVLLQLEAGEEVIIQGGQANLKRGLQAAQPKPHDLIRVTYTDNRKTANGTMKVFKVEVARAAAPTLDGDTPPF